MCPKCNGGKLDADGKDYYCNACRTNFDGIQILTIKLINIEKRLEKLEEAVLDLLNKNGK